jgi:hypothetical protein
MVPIEEGLDGLAEVLEQVLPVGDLLGLGCSLGGRFDVDRPAISAHHLDLGMVPEPTLNAGRLHHKL